MASVKEILKNPMHKEIEKIKTELSKEAWALPWSDYKRIIAKDMKEFFGPRWGGEGNRAEIAHRLFFKFLD